MHGRRLLKPRHEPAVDALFPAPDPTVWPDPQTAPQGPGLRAAFRVHSPEQLECPLLRSPAAQCCPLRQGVEVARQGCGCANGPYPGRGTGLILHNGAVPSGKYGGMPYHLKAGLGANPSAFAAAGKTTGLQPFRGLAACAAQPWSCWMQVGVGENLNVQPAQAGQERVWCCVGSMQKLQPAFRPTLPQGHGHFDRCESFAENLEGRGVVWAFPWHPLVF